MHSEQINELAAALSKAQGKYQPVTKSKTVTVNLKSGRAYSYSYAPLEDILKATREALSENGLAVSQLLDEGSEGVVLQTLLVHSSGQWISSYRNLGNHNDPQSFGGQLTYYRRYALSSILGISSEDDDDASGASGKDVEITQKPKKQVAKPTVKPKNGNGHKSARPLPPEELRKYLKSRAQELNKPGKASAHQAKAVVMSVNALTNGNDDKRHEIMTYLFGAKSAKDLTVAEASKLIEWSGCKKDNDYQPDFNSVQEAQMILNEVEFWQADGAPEPQETMYSEDS